MADQTETSLCPEPAVKDCCFIGEKKMKPFQCKSVKDGFRCVGYAGNHRTHRHGNMWWTE